RVHGRGQRFRPLGARVWREVSVPPKLTVDVPLHHRAHNSHERVGRIEILLLAKAKHDLLFGVSVISFSHFVSVRHPASRTSAVDREIEPNRTVCIATSPFAVDLIARTLYVTDAHPAGSDVSR